MIGICKTCQQEKELARYQKAKGGKYYFRKFCIVCWSAERADFQKEYRETHSEHLQKYHAAKHERKKSERNTAAKRYYQKLQSQVFEFYGNQCACCGEREKKFLTLDHKNDDGANHRRQIGVGHIFYRWIIENNYPSSIQLLCNNCNAGKHRNGGVCPHHNTYNSQSDFMCYSPQYSNLGI